MNSSACLIFSMQYDSKQKKARCARNILKNVQWSEEAVNTSGRHEFQVFQCICCCHPTRFLLCGASPKHNGLQACWYGQENYFLIWREQETRWTHYWKALLKTKPYNAIFIIYAESTLVRNLLSRISCMATETMYLRDKEEENGENCIM